MNSTDMLIEQIRNRQVPTTKRRNSMGCSENWYNPVYAITETFSREEVDGMTYRELTLLITLADRISDGLY